MGLSSMNRLIEMLGDGHARTVRMLADELGTTESDVMRQIEYLEHMGVIRKVIGDDAASCGGGPACSAGCGGSCGGKCSGCTSGGGNMCHSCMPDGGFKNMGRMWELTGRG